MTDFAVTWDYRCPFARNAHEHLLAGLRGGGDWNVTFVPFSLGQVHVEEGEAPIWERPDDDSGLLALQVGVWVRDNAPEAFLGLHGALFSLRHDQGGDLRDRDLLAGAIEANDLSATEVFGALESGSVLDQIRDEHQTAVKDHDVWGVPTFIRGEAAAFVRLLDWPGDDLDHARSTIDRIVDLLAVSNLNEFKHTKVPF